MTSRSRTVGMSPSRRAFLLLLTLAGLGAGCSLPSPKRDAAAIQERLLDDTEERQARLKASETLSPQAYEALARKMGWTDRTKSGLPPPPSTEELGRRLQTTEKKP